MNTKEKAAQEILDFLRSDNKVLLLTGTYQNEKHSLALLLILSEYPSPANILFRANHSRNIKMFLSVLNLRKNPKTGKPIKISGGYNLYIDTINQMSWNSSPSHIDIAVVYPVGSLGESKGDDCVQDLIRRNAKKIVLVSCIDNKDISWVEQFNPVKVIYDSEEVDPEYHARTQEIVSNYVPQPISGLPEYAKNIPSEYLIQLYCKGCNSGRWAKLNKPYPGKTALKNAPIGEYTANCLKCGYENVDNYNWYER